MERYPADTIEVETDVLVIGGGAAGCLAALGTRKAGVQVVLVEKAGAIRRSGSCASGIDSYKVLLEEAPWDTPEAYLGGTARSRSTPDDGRVQETFARNSKRVFRLLEDIGVPFRDRVSGRYERVVPLGTSHPTNVSFDGSLLKPVMGQAVRQAGVKVVERVAVEGLLTRGRRVVGAAGFHVRQGQFYIFRARSVVMTAGGAVRFYPPSSGESYMTHTPPYNTGDGQAMAFRAGADLTNMEFTGCSIEPLGFSAPGLSAFIGLGARLLNAHGERYMLKYHPLGEHAPRVVMVRAMLAEMAGGRGPCYFDCRHFSAQEIDRLKRDLSNGKPTLMDYFAARGLDLAHDLIPFAPREMDCNGNGIIIDGECRSSMEGLFAAGNCASAALALPGACTLGYVAGESAAAAIGTGSPSPRATLDEPAEGQVDEIRDALFRPLFRRGGVAPMKLEEKLRQTMKEAVGFYRNDQGLRKALRTLSGLRQEANRLEAAGLHELLRAHEARNLIEVSLMIVSAALERRESRGSHSRSDFPRTEDGWRGFVVLTRDPEDQIETHFRPVALEVSGGATCQR